MLFLHNKHIAKDFNTWVQYALPLCAIISWTCIAYKHAEYGLLFAFCAQALWLHVTYRGWKKAGQIGGFITTVFEISIISLGVFNYWL